MVTRFLTVLTLIAALGIHSPAVYAQYTGPNQVQSQELEAGPRKQVATIIFAGLAGAILGLSTLSFYGRPQDKLSNIAIGFALGIITGATYTTYKAATKPRQFYEVRLNETETWQSLEGLSASSYYENLETARLAWSWDF